MPTLSDFMSDYQVEWRKENVSSSEMGTWSGKPYPWILPSQLWEEGLWPGIRAGSDNSVAAYLQQTGVQKHTGANNLKSSWALCTNLYFPFRANDFGRTLFASFLRHHVVRQIKSLEEVELEYAEDGELNPAVLLGETGGSRGSGQTSPDLDLRVNDGRGLVLVESKFTEPHFSNCSAQSRWKRRGLPGNPNPDRCEDAMAVVQDPCNQCHQTTWGRRYWEHLAQSVNRQVLATMPYCPASKKSYQLLRQTAFAEGIAQSGEYELVVSAVAFDERNSELDGCLRNIGIPSLRHWGKVFQGRAHFAVFTHQQWVAWVREHDSKGRWLDWLSWIETRYALKDAM